MALTKPHGRKSLEEWAGSSAFPAKLMTLTATVIAFISCSPPLGEAYSRDRGLRDMVRGLSCSQNRQGNGGSLLMVGVANYETDWPMKDAVK
jgi:hypothetical protein